MGHGIVEVAGISGFDMRMRDVDEKLVREGYEDIEWSLGKMVENEQLSQTEANDSLDRIEPIVDLATAVKETDFVIEAVPKRMEIKRSVFEEAEESAPDRTVFATNPSTLSITELSEATEHPERFYGMHFFNPPVRMELIEVIRGDHTAGRTSS